MEAASMAYAKLLGTHDFVAYITDLPCVLGRAKLTASTQLSDYPEREESEVSAAASAAASAASSASQPLRQSDITSVSMPVKSEPSTATLSASTKPAKSSAPSPSKPSLPTPPTPDLVASESSTSAHSKAHEQKNNFIAIGARKNISRRHAEIRFDALRQVYTITCLSTHNGIFVDGVYLPPKPDDSELPARPSPPPSAPVPASSSPGASSSAASSSSSSSASSSGAPQLQQPGLVLPSSMDLADRSLVKIGDKVFYFLLPKNFEQRNSAVSISAPSPAGASSSSAAASSSTASSSPLSLNIVPFLHAPTPREWNIRDCDKFRHAILSFGFGRWSKVHAAMETDKFSVDQVEAMGLHFVARLHELSVESRHEPLPGFAALLKHATDRGVVSATIAPILHSWTTIRKHIKTWMRKLVSLEKMRLAVELRGLDNLMDGVTKVRGRVPCPWWTPQQDLDLLKGVWKHGYGYFKRIREDMSLSFASRMSQLALERGSQVQEDEPLWPMTISLVSRWRHVLQAVASTLPAITIALDLPRPKAKGKRRKRRVPSGTESVKRRKLEEADAPPAVPDLHVWKRVQLDCFQRALMTFGPTPPSWEKVRALQPKLGSKSDEALSHYWIAFMKALAGYGFTVPEPLGWSHEQLPPLPEGVKLHASISQNAARKIMARFDLLDTMRKASNHAEFEARVALALPPSDLPGWWETPRHDMDLVRGFVKHGFSQWEALMADSELAFHGLADAKPPARPAVSRRLKELTGLFKPGTTLEQVTTKQRKRRQRSETRKAKKKDSKKDADGDVKMEHT